MTWEFWFADVDKDMAREMDMTLEMAPKIDILYNFIQFGSHMIFLYFSEIPKNQKNWE